MKNLLLVLSIAVLISACHKQDPLPDHEGRIINSWDGKGIPGAALHLLDYVPSGSWLSGGYDVLDSIHTNEAGNFTLPRSPHYDALGADHVEFYRIDDPVVYGSSTLGLLSLSLNPRAWVKFSAEDTGSESPEVTKVEVISQDQPWVGDHSILSTPSETRAVNSSVGSGQIFVKIYTGQEFELSIIDIELIKNDTLHMVIEY